MHRAVVVMYHVASSNGSAPGCWERTEVEYGAEADDVAAGTDVHRTCILVPSPGDAQC